MKNSIIAMAFLALMMVAQTSMAYQTVRGYIKSNGTVVSPYIRSNPDSFKWNNLSSMNSIKLPTQTPFNPDRQNVAQNFV